LKKLQLVLTPKEIDISNMREKGFVITEDVYIDMLQQRMLDFTRIKLLLKEE
jgi:hypothetical protein